MCLLAFAAASAEQATVTLVHRGDLFQTDAGKLVRIIGIAVPEVYLPGGDICRDALEKYVQGRSVRLESDGKDKDANGYLLRHVFLGDTLVSAELVRKGFAEVTGDSGRRFADSLLKLERIAARAEKGLWPFEVFAPPAAAPAARPGSAGAVWLETVSWQDAGKYYGRLVTVEGTVVATYRSDKVLMLNFHQDYRKHFKVAVFADKLAKFPEHPEDFYKKRLVRVTGIVKEYEGAPEMVIDEPGQIQVEE
jgi:micrococcal nuclease